MSLIKLKAVTKSFHQQTVISDLSFSISQHQFLCVLGRSGSGKSTLLRLIAGLIQPDFGSIEFSNPVSNEMSFVFQEPRLLPWRTALENVNLPLELKNIKSSQAEFWLEKFGLKDSMNKLPGELSGGMKMRVALARALATEPKFILMDEPFSALDEPSREQLQDEIKQLYKEKSDLNIVFVTHSLTEAVYLADRVLILNSHGRISFEQNFNNCWQSADRLSSGFVEVLQNLSKEFRASL